MHTQYYKMAAPTYTDFNLPYQNHEQLYDTFRLAVSLGFERVAINKFIVDLRGQKSKKQKEKVIIPPPSEILLTDKNIQSVQENGKKVEQLSRISTVLDDAANTHRLASPEVQAYDIIAVQPTDEKTFQLACATLEVDIIMLNFSELFKFPFKRPLVNLAIERGIHFEIVYCPALQDNSVKRNIISNSLQFANVGKGKNIIISSGAEQAIHLRGPQDIINLAQLFGLNKIQAKDSISRNCRAALLHAASRKSAKSVISVKLASLLTSKEEWLLKMKNASVEEDNSGGDTSDDVSDQQSEEDENDNEEPEIKKIKL